MSAFRLHVLFAGVDFEDDHVFDALSELQNVDWLESNGSVIALATVEAASALAAADALVADVRNRVPDARPIRIDPDLVSVADIADRVGVTREAVRNWAKGLRRDGGFPAPLGVVGAASKPTYVWGWARVNEWLEANLGLGDGFTYPTPLEEAEINVRLMTPPPSISAPVEWKTTELHAAPDLWFDLERTGVMIDPLRQLERVARHHAHTKTGRWTTFTDDRAALDLAGV